MPSSSSSSTTTKTTTNSSSFDIVRFIRIKRLQERDYTATELHTFVQALDTFPDYQVAAWLMCVSCRGLSATETAALTRAIVESGVQLNWNNNYKDTNTNTNEDDTTNSDKNNKPLLLLDKHSTGGVGDKVSILLAPLVASFDKKYKVPMMAGRGLAHTGGTIDKLHSIPGMRCDHSIHDFCNIVQRTGCAIVSATNQMCPADRKLYALRDVTDTVSCLGLQTASILSKKIAERPHTLVLDVKYGNGSFQATQQDAQALAVSLVHTGMQNGIATSALLTRMDEPLGYNVGNWLEILECLDILKGQKTTVARDLVTVTILLAAQMISEYACESFEEICRQCVEKLKNGQALETFKDMVRAQGGDVAVLDDPSRYPESAKHKTTVHAKQTGYIQSVHAYTIGCLSVSLGAGRRVADDPVDNCSGVVLARKVGDRVSMGEELGTLYSNAVITDSALLEFESAIHYSDEPVTVPPCVTHLVTKDGEIQPIVIPDLGL